jgi:hypothetical protein
MIIRLAFPQGSAFQKAFDRHVPEAPILYHDIECIMDRIRTNRNEQSPS